MPGLSDRKFAKVNQLKWFHGLISCSVLSSLPFFSNLGFSLHFGVAVEGIIHGLRYSLPRWRNQPSTTDKSTAWNPSTRHKLKVQIP